MSQTPVRTSLVLHPTSRTLWGGFKSSPPGHFGSTHTSQLGQHIPISPTLGHLQQMNSSPRLDRASPGMLPGSPQPMWAGTAVLTALLSSPGALPRSQTGEGSFSTLIVEAILAFSRAWELPCPNPLSKLSFAGDPCLELRSTLAPTSLLHKH